MLFTKTLTATVVGAAALAGVAATPARADNNDVIRFLAGATALAIIIDATNDHHARPAPRYVYAPPRPQRPVVVVRPREHVVVRPRTVIIERPSRHGYGHDYRYDNGRNVGRAHQPADSRWSSNQPRPWDRNDNAHGSGRDWR